MRIIGLALFCTLVAISFAFPSADVIWNEFYRPTKLTERSKNFEQLAYCARQFVLQRELLDEGVLKRVKYNKEEIDSYSLFGMKCGVLVENSLIRQLWHEFQENLTEGSKSPVDTIKIEGCGKEGFNHHRIGENELAIMVLAEVDHTEKDSESLKSHFQNLMNKYEAGFDDCLVKLRSEDVEK